MLNWMPPRAKQLAIEAFQFLTVGGISYIVDVGLSNLLVFGLWIMPALMHDSPLKAKIISTVVSVAVSWLGNRLWTYGKRQTGSNIRGMVRFAIVNLVGMGVVLVPGWFTVYILGLRDPVSYNISMNIVGIALGMVFRFFAYRHWVFKEEPAHPDRETIPVDDDASVGTR
jgi:putative flippase GtrA